VLVALEARPGGLDDTLHAGIGLVVLAAVCGAVIALLSGTAQDVAQPQAATDRNDIASRALRLQGALLLACALVPLARAHAPAAAAPTAHEWPQQRDGRLLQPLAMQPVEQRFAARFPGRIGRFTDGQRVIVLRQVLQPTRMLHPAADCYRALGYRIAQARLDHAAQARLWRCFVATRDGQRLRVCERIEAGDGSAFTDASSWFWAAVMGRSRGPWQAITQVESS
jgi:hypothetical protein